MPVSYADVIDRVVDVAAELPEEQRRDVRRVAEIARAHGSSASNEDPRRELGRLAELLGRRGARALPAAALSRALLADLRGAAADRDASLADCDAKLAMFGL